MDEPIGIAERYPAKYWHRLDDGRIQCELCPRDCKLHEGQRSACCVRGRISDAMVLTTYGRSFIVRDWHLIRNYAVTENGECSHCGTKLAGQFGRQRIPLAIRNN